MVSNKHGAQQFTLASLAKVFIAETIGYQVYDPPKNGIAQGVGEMPVSAEPEAELRDRMIRLSDNDATTRLWDTYGRSEIIDNAAKRYDLPDTTSGGLWTLVKSTPEDMCRFFDGILDGRGGLSREETDYYKRLLISVPKYSYGAMNQDIGIRAAMPEELVGQKNGWVDPSRRTTAGFFGEDQRFTIAVLTTGVNNPNDLTDAIRTVVSGTGAYQAENAAQRRQPVDPEDMPQAAETKQLSDGGGIPVALAVLGALAAAAIGFGLGWFIRRS
nr:class A beta-lactamase-related serine hydrolase [Corynebacterium sp. TAE3-ERU12]